MLYYKPDIGGTSAPGPDIVTMKDGLPYIFDNKAYATGSDVYSATALDRNFDAGIKVVVEKFNELAVDPNLSSEDRNLYAEAVRHIEAGECVKVITNAAFAEDGQHSEGISDQLASRGIQFLDLTQNSSSSTLGQSSSSSSSSAGQTGDPDAGVGANPYATAGELPAGGVPEAPAEEGSGDWEADGAQEAMLGFSAGAAAVCLAAVAPEVAGATVETVETVETVATTSELGATSAGTMAETTEAATTTADVGTETAEGVADTTEVGADTARVRVEPLSDEPRIRVSDDLHQADDLAEIEEAGGEGDARLAQRVVTVSAGAPVASSTNAQTFTSTGSLTSSSSDPLSSSQAGPQSSSSTDSQSSSSSGGSSTGDQDDLPVPTDQLSDQPGADELPTPTGELTGDSGSGDLPVPTDEFSADSGPDDLPAPTGESHGDSGSGDLPAQTGETGSGDLPVPGSQTHEQAGPSDQSQDTSVLACQPQDMSQSGT